MRDNERRMESKDSNKKENVIRIQYLILDSQGRDKNEKNKMSKKIKKYINILSCTYLLIIELIEKWIENKTIFSKILLYSYIEQFSIK